MNIAIFDENESESELLSLYIQEYCKQHLLIHHIFCFDSLSHLLCQALSGKFDLAFIHVTSASFKQIQTSHLFQKAPLKPLIVFTVSETDITAALLRTHAFAFLLKPLHAADFLRIFERCLKQLPPADYFITVKEARQMIDIPLYEILYTCNDNHYVCIHTTCRTIRTYMPFLQLWEHLSSFESFILYYHSAAVNLLHVSQISRSSIFLSNHEVLPISRTLLTQTKKAYSNYQHYHKTNSQMKGSFHEQITDFKREH